MKGHDLFRLLSFQCLEAHIQLFVTEGLPSCPRRKDPERVNPVHVFQRKCAMVILTCFLPL